MGRIALAKTPIVVLAALALSGCPPTATDIAGWGNSGGTGGWDLTVVAMRDSLGNPVGHGHVHGGADGPVVQIVPPSASANFWCINVKRVDVGAGTPDPRLNIYIEDVGDGKITFDRFQLTSSLSKDCTSLPSPSGNWLTFQQGDFDSF
jgi:hypothetical protein